MKVENDMCFLPDDDTLVLTINHHVSVHVVCQSVDVRRVLILSLRGDRRLIKFKGRTAFAVNFVETIHLKS